MKVSDSICFRCSTAYKKEVEVAAKEKGYKSVSDYAKDSISKDMYNKQSSQIKYTSTDVIHPNIVAGAHTEYGATTTSRTQILEKLADLSEKRAKNASLAGDHDAAEKLYAEATGYYKELLAEMGEVADRKHASTSKTVSIMEDDIEIIE
jgi:hypothetical protein